ncbi:MAG: FMN-binding negative transcriptional regulator [Pseudomonadota bacterium]
MHPNQAFRAPGRDANLAFAAARGFGVLTVSGPDGPLAAHVPFILDGPHWEAHLLRSNPLYRALEAPLPALVIVSGPDGYVSPDWYETPDQVPTWNYIAVHLRGTLRRLDPDGILAHSARLSAQFEGRLEKRPWTLDKMSDGVAARMARAIAPVALDISSVEGTWKLNQNKDDVARHAAAAHMDETQGQELGALSALMRNPPRTD